MVIHASHHALHGIHMVEVYGMWYPRTNEELYNTYYVPLQGALPVCGDYSTLPSIFVLFCGLLAPPGRCCLLWLCWDRLCLVWLCPGWDVHKVYSQQLWYSKLEGLP
jgi:hypothetical protein